MVASHPKPNRKPVEVIHKINNQLQYVLSALELEAFDHVEVAILEVEMMLGELHHSVGTSTKARQRSTMIRDRMDHLMWKWSNHAIECRQCAIWDLNKDIVIPNAPDKPCQDGVAIILRMSMYLQETVA